MPSKGQSILIGALAYTVLGVLANIIATSGAGGAAAGTLSCLVLFVASIVAVWHYTNTYKLTLPAGQGAGLGAAATVIGMILAFGIGLLLQSLGILPSPEEALEMARANMEAQGMSDEQVEGAMAMTERLSSPLTSFLVGIPMAAIAGAIGGAISAMIFKKGERVA